MPKHSMPVLIAVAALVGCGTIIHGSRQDVGISSSPTGAAVTVDNESFGITPTIAKLSRKDHHIVRITLNGYQPFEATVTRRVSGWVWGNIVFGGLIGLAVDAISGGLYKLTPEQITAQLTATGSNGASMTGDGLYVTVVLAPAPEWEKIGQMNRE